MSFSFPTLTERIKINAISREIRDGRSFWIKRRRWTAAPILAGANAFFCIAGAPLRAITSRATWQRWEVDCFLGLHGDRFHACTEGLRAVAAEELPGVNLTIPLDTGALTPAMAAAAAHELCRVHEWRCPATAAPWSHGDPHLGNFILETAAERARIIDFEVRHAADLHPDERHADDLLVFLQDMAGRIAEDRWLPCAHAFLAAYGRPAIVARLAPQLVLPRPGFARLWWKVRASFLPHAELVVRIAALRKTL